MEKVLIDIEKDYLTLDKYKMGQNDPLNSVYNTQGDKLGDLIDSYGEKDLHVCIFRRIANHNGWWKSLP